jgi:hypothetical protein
MSWSSIGREEWDRRSCGVLRGGQPHHLVPFARDKGDSHISGSRGRQALIWVQGIVQHDILSL